MNEYLTDTAADFMNSPARQPASLPIKTDTTSRNPSDTHEPEPLLALLTSTHPILSTAINGSLSAYSSSKTYSPRFRYGAEFVERHIGNPVASTVGTAGRISGVETGVRWWLQRADSQGQEGSSSSNKRRKVDNDRDVHKEMDIEKGLQDVEPRPLPESQPHRPSSEMSFAESLPAYDDHRSPRYEEQSSMTRTRRSQSPHGQNWQTRFMMSTSGLGVAMSEESLRSLKYCLSWLRWANEHLGKTIVSLKNVLEEWSRSQQQKQQQQQRSPDFDTAMTGHDAPTQSANGDDGHRPPRDQATITSHLTALKTDILSTLKKVVDIVSTYAGGALPDNARALVHRHLTTLPQRFRLASTSSTSSSSSSSSSSTASGSETDAERQSQTESGAKRVLVLAMEGLDMMSQVAGVVDGTIGSAEEWCERLGRRARNRGEGEGEGQRMQGGGEGGVGEAGEHRDVEVEMEKKEMEKGGWGKDGGLMGRADADADEKRG